MIDDFGTPFDSDCLLSFQVKLPKCYLRNSNELKVDLLKRLPDKTLIYIFYNFENKQIQLEAAKQLYQREWVYNYEELLWFHKLNLNDLANPQFLHLKKWELVSFHYPLRRDQFVKLEEFETHMKIKDSPNTSN